MRVATADEALNNEGEVRQTGDEIGIAQLRNRETVRLLDAARMQ